MLNLIRKLFGLPPLPPQPKWQPEWPPNPDDMQHPELGLIYMDTVESWFSDKIECIGCAGTTGASFCGDEHGPFPATMETYRRLKTDWSTLAPAIAQTLLELNHNYFSDEPERALKSADEIWSTAKMESFSVGPDGTFSLTYTFDWQRDGDLHIITVECEDFLPVGTSIDG